jgi:hypothetical protein
MMYAREINVFTSYTESPNWSSVIFYKVSTQKVGAKVYFREGNSPD